MEHFFIEQLSPLYEDVQTGGVFPDSKFFPDSSPKSTPEAILAAYSEAKTQANFDLKKFVETHFDFPETPETNYQSADKPILQHLDNLWDVLLRKPSAADEPLSTVIPLPFPYIVPGGRFREVYY